LGTTKHDPSPASAIPQRLKNTFILRKKAARGRSSKDKWALPGGDRCKGRSASEKKSRIQSSTVRGTEKKESRRSIAAKGSPDKRKGNRKKPTFSTLAISHLKKKGKSWGKVDPSLNLSIPLREGRAR